MILKLWNDNAGITVTLHAADDERARIRLHSETTSQGVKP